MKITFTNSLTCHEVYMLLRILQPRCFAFAQLLCHLCGPPFLNVARLSRLIVPSVKSSAQATARKLWQVLLLLFRSVYSISLQLLPVSICSQRAVCRSCWCCPLAHGQVERISLKHIRNKWVIWSSFKSEVRSGDLNPPNQVPCQCAMVFSAQCDLRKRSNHIK